MFLKFILFSLLVLSFQSSSFKKESQIFLGISLDSSNNASAQERKTETFDSDKSFNCILEPLYVLPPNRSCSQVFLLISSSASRSIHDLVSTLVVTLFCGKKEKQIAEATIPLSVGKLRRGDLNNITMELMKKKSLHSKAQLKITYKSYPHKYSALEEVFPPPPLHAALSLFTLHSELLGKHPKASPVTLCHKANHSSLISLSSLSSYLA